MRVVVSESPRYVDFLYETPEGSGNTAMPPSPWKSPTTPYAHIVVPSVQKPLCLRGCKAPVSRHQVLSVTPPEQTAHDESLDLKFLSLVKLGY